MAWTRNRPLGLVYRDAEKSAGGYTLYSAVRGRHASLLDDEGRVVYHWYHPEGIQHLKLMPGGHLLAHGLPSESAEGAESIGGNARSLFELDRDSRVVWEYLDPYMHHDYQRLANGNTLVVRWDKLPLDISPRVPGGHTATDDPEWMWGDVIREIDPAGATVAEWKTWEHLAPERHPKCPLESRKEWTHLNSIELTPDGDWLLSFRLTDTVMIVDGTTGDVRWRYGPAGLSHQHHATWLENGNILVFDNGCHRRESPSHSTVIEIDRATKKVVWSYKAEPILAFFSFMVGSSERLPNGNTMITEGATGRLFEVTAEGETVWEFVSPWGLPSPYGRSTAVFRSYRIAADDPRLEGLDLDHRAYASINERTAAGTPLTEDDEAALAR